jgi:hypothetical protein
MNWSRSSKAALAALVVGLVVAAAAAGPAAAVSVAAEDVPEEAAAGSQVTATVTLAELYQNPQLESWQLAGDSQLRNVTWTVIMFDQTGSQVTQESFNGQNFTSSAVAAEDGTAEVELRVTGTVPPVSEFSYDPPQQFLLASLALTREGGSSTDIGSWQAHYYTAASDDARTRLDTARSTIEGTDADTGEASETFDSAVDAYESGNFDNAVTLADRAASQAESAQQNSQLVQYAMYGVGGLVVVGAAVGGVLWYRSNQDSYDKLG